MAEIPQTIHYQGKLTDMTGVGENVLLAMHFRLFDVPSGGDSLWGMTVPAVPVVHGLFDVNIGPIDLPFDEQYWLEIVVDGEVLSPRVQLNSSPYAFRAAVADSFTGGISPWTQDTLKAYWDSLRNVPAGFSDGIDDTGAIIGVKDTMIAYWDSLRGIPADIADGDDLGNHTATQNIKTNGHWLSNDGHNEGIFISTIGNVGVNVSSIGTNQFQVGSQADAVDQQCTSPTTQCGWGNVAQTFTAGIEGMLTAVEIDIWYSSVPANATLTIYNGEGSGGATLISQTITITQTGHGTPTRFDLTTPVDVISGNTYSYCISGLVGIATLTSTSNPYPGGKICNGCNDCSWQGGSWDMWFKTYVKQSDLVVIDAVGKVGIGTDSPTSKLDIVGLPIFANNTAAIAGGLSVGALYRTGGDPDVVCVVH